ncbi:hypothetical protein, partial [Rhodopirellula bahusiensis]
GAAYYGIGLGYGVGYSGIGYGGFGYDSDYPRSYSSYYPSYTAHRATYVAPRRILQRRAYSRCGR